MRLLLTSDGHYDLACGLDFYNTFYDQWVARDVNGDPFYSHFPFVRDATSAARVRRDQWFEAKCCWNGVAVMRAAPFLLVRALPFAMCCYPNANNICCFCVIRTRCGFVRSQSQRNAPWPVSVWLCATTLSNTVIAAL